MNPASRIFVAGHQGMVGSAIFRRLEGEGYHNVAALTRAELDLTDRSAVLHAFRQLQPEYVFVAAAKVGGILANDSSPVDFLRDNLAIELAVLDAAHCVGVRKLLFLGSSCVYPKFAPQPIKEEYLLTAPLESTNEWYAIAKIAGIKLCQAYRRQFGDDFIAAMPTNLYGPGDNFDLTTSHVLPAFIRKFHEAKERGSADVVLWGTGTPRREFMHVDDVADASVYLMHHYSAAEPINVGVGDDIEIQALADVVRGIVGFTGGIRWDAARPDGTPRKLLDVTRLHDLGWRDRISLETGIRATYEWFLQNVAQRSVVPLPR